MPGNAECEAGAERDGEAKPRARRLLENIGLREVARIKASATLKNEESPAERGRYTGAGAIPVGA